MRAIQRCGKDEGGDGEVWNGDVRPTTVQAAAPLAAYGLELRDRSFVTDGPSARCRPVARGRDGILFAQIHIIHGRSRTTV